MEDYTLQNEQQQEIKLVAQQQAPAKNGKAVAALVCGIGALVTFAGFMIFVRSLPVSLFIEPPSFVILLTRLFLGLTIFNAVLAIIGIVLGYLARKDPRAKRQRLALAGLIASVLALVAAGVVIFLLIYAAIRVQQYF